MDKKIRSAENYYKVVTAVWKFFRKFYAEYDADDCLKAVYDFENWLKTDRDIKDSVRIYEYGMKLIRATYEELGWIDEARKYNEDNAR